MVAMFLLIGFEFWVMHHHSPDPPPVRDTSRVPGMASGPPRDDTTKNPPVVRHPMVAADTGGRKDSATAAGTQTLAQQEGKSANGGTVVLEPPKLPPDLTDDTAPANTNAHAGGEGEEEEEYDEGEEGYGDMRVAVLVPYSGPGLPLWFDAFTELAAASSAVVDWIIFCEEVRK